MKEIISVSYETFPDINDQDIISFAHGAVNNPQVRSNLQERFLNSVIQRYEKVGTDLHARESTLAGIRNLKDSANPNRGFVIMTSTSNKIIGLGSLQPNAELWEQKMYFPTRLARLATRKGLELSESVDTAGMSNICAWVTTEDELTAKEQLKSAYSQIANWSPTPVWTLNPDRPGTAYVHEALCESGFIINGPQSRYDDLEATGLQVAPIARLMTRGLRPDLT